MKIDRFVKVILVLIAVLLTLNCAKDLPLSSNSRGGSNNVASSKSSAGSRSPSMFETPVEAAPPPSFLQVGMSYNFNQGNMSTDVEVVEIQDTGWIKGKNNLGNMVWINPNACYQIRPNR